VKTCPTDALQFGDREELLSQAKKRITASPGRYVNHIYGENEVGGTSWLYISPVPFDKLGFPKLGSQPVTVDAERAMGAVLPVLVGVAATMSSIYWLIQRRQSMKALKQDSERKGENK
jgi:formate dehydrogenase iron-sulfur subunit